MLLEKCKTWLSEVVSSRVPPQIGLDSLISMWNFGFNHGEYIYNFNHVMMMAADKKE